jgi:hypothetical protein
LYNIAYIYSAREEKLAKKMTNGTYQYYAGSMVYKNDKALNYLLTDEGMVNKSSGGYVRVTFQPNGNGTTLTQAQATEYYPFGMNYALLALYT